MKPTINPCGNGYILDWSDYKLKLIVSRLHVHNDGRVTGELEIKTIDGEKTFTLHPASTFNFSSDTTRTRLAKALAEKRNSIDWTTVIDFLCKNILDLSRCGEPVVDVYAGDETTEPPRYLLEPFIIENYPNIIFGDPGSLKSTFALLLAELVMLPCPENVLDLNVKPESIRVLYLDWETDLATIKWQLTLLQNGLGINPLSIQYRRCSLPLSQDLDALRTVITTNGIRLVTIDSLGLACGGELKEAMPALEFFKALRTLNVTSLILAHSPKDNENIKKKSIYGSMYFRALSRNIWEIQKQQDQDSDIAHISLYHDKPAPFQNTHRPIGFKFIYGDRSLSITTEDPKSIPEFLERHSTKERIKKELLSGASSVKEIAESLGKKENNIRVVLSAMKAQGTVEKVGELYGLPSNQEPLSSL